MSPGKTEDNRTHIPQRRVILEKCVNHKTLNPFLQDHNQSLSSILVLSSKNNTHIGKIKSQNFADGLHIRTWPVFYNALPFCKP